MSAAAMNKVLRDLKPLGYSFTKTHRNHWKIQHPDMVGAVYASSTPSDYRSVRNLIARLRRA